MVEKYELYSLNFVLAEGGNIWALRYPEHNPLHLLRRHPSDGGKLEHADEGGTLQLRSEDAAETPVVVISSEEISEEPGWEEIASGELVHVGPDLAVDRETIVSGEPRHPMVLHHSAAKSQAYA